MNKNELKVFLKDFNFGALWFGILVILALIIKNVGNYSFADIIFFEGLILAVSGTLSSMSGDPLGLGIQSLGIKHPHDVTETNYEITAEEKGNLALVLKKDLLFGTTTAPLVIGGLMAILFNFMLI